MRLAYLLLVHVFRLQFGVRPVALDEGVGELVGDLEDSIGPLEDLGVDLVENLVFDFGQLIRDHVSIVVLMLVIYYLSNLVSLSFVIKVGHKLISRVADIAVVFVLEVFDAELEFLLVLPDLLLELRILVESLDIGLCFSKVGRHDPLCIHCKLPVDLRLQHLLPHVLLRDLRPQLLH